MILLLACTHSPESTPIPHDSPGQTDSTQDSPTDTSQDSPTDSAQDSPTDTSPPCTGLIVSQSAEIPSNSTLDFGSAPSLTSAITQRLNLQNPCQDQLRFLGHPDDWISGDAFALDTLPPVYLEPGESTTLDLSFSPGEPGTQNASFSLPYDQPGSPYQLNLLAQSANPLRLVFVGDGGHLLSSPDYGLTADMDSYSTLSAHTAALIRGVCAGPTGYVAVGGNAERAWWTSPDGQSWESGTDTGSPLADCAWYNGRFIGSDGAPVWSEDGQNWTRGTGSLSAHLRAMTAGDFGVVGVGDDGQIALSLTGEQWDWSGQPTTSSFQRVVFGNGLYVAAGEAGATLVSSDGQNWVASSTGGNSVQGLVFADDAFLLADGSTLYRSEDGISWDQVNATTVSPLVGVEGMLIGVTNNTLYRSEDGGFLWEQGTSSLAGLGFLDGVLEVQP
jgi:hypothetical protein